MSELLIEPRDIFHIRDGHTRMSAVDAAHCVGNFPLEWSYVAWSEEVLERAKATVRRNEELASKPIVGALKQG